MHPATMCGNALELPFGGGLLTLSPPHRPMAIGWPTTTTPTTRRRCSYTHDMGHPLHPDNTGAMQWGDDYRDHMAAWEEALRLLRPGGRFVLNIKDHVRGGEYVDVAAWHVRTLTALGCVVSAVRPVGSGSLRAGANADVRVDAELVIAFDRD